jgi:uncharacterized protein (TIGR03083 family)
MYNFAGRLRLLQAESERIKQYFHSLPPDALRQPSACTQWQVQDVIAHLIGVAETYAGNLSRGLQGDTAPPAGRRPAGQNNAASSAEGIAQRSIAARQALGDQLLAAFDAANDHLNRLLEGLSPQQRETPCYHPGGMVAAQNFIDLRLKEFALHEWDVRAWSPTRPSRPRACRQSWKRFRNPLPPAPCAGVSGRDPLLPPRSGTALW